MQIINIREHPEYLTQAIDYFQLRWGNRAIYEDCISHSIGAKSPIPIWYLLMDGSEIVGGAGLITNDFISRMDLSPWLCALHIEEKYRGQGLGSRLIEHIKQDVAKLNLDKLYLCTDHIGYYEKYGFIYIGDGYHPWGERSRIYEIEVTK